MWCYFGTKPSKHHESWRTTIFQSPRPLLLTIGHLKKIGILDGKTQPCWVNIGANIRVWHGDHGQLVVTAPKYDLDVCNENNVNDSSLWTVHGIRYVLRELNFGPRPYFICPITGDDCLKLVFYRGLVSSISAFNLISGDGALSLRAVKYEARRAKLLKYDGTLRSSKEERETLLTFLRKHPRRLNEDENIIAFLEREERRKERERKKFLWESRELSTTKALDCGRGANQHAAFEEYLRLGIEWAHNIPLVDPPAALPIPDSLEHYGVLDIRILLDRGYFDHDRVAGNRLGWSADATGVRSIYLFSDSRHSGMPLLIARIEAEDSTVTWQSIRLLPSARSARPRYMLCPFSHIRSDILYFRNGVFASREAQGLYNSLQRSAGRKIRMSALGRKRT